MKRSGIIPERIGSSSELFIDSLQPGCLPDEPQKKASPTWAAMIKRVYACHAIAVRRRREVDPLTCPRCGSTMKIIAFLTNSREINKICDNLGLPSWRAPPPWQTPPSNPEPTVVPLFDHIEFEHVH